MAKFKYLSYPIGMRVRVKTGSGWHSVVQKGEITGVRKIGNSYEYSLQECAWVNHHELVPRKKQPPTLGADNGKD